MLADRDVKVRDSRGLKREAEETAGKKKLKQLAWSRQEVTRTELEQSDQSRTQEPHLSVSYQETSKDLPPLRPHNDNGKENDTKPQEKTRDDEKSRSCEKDSNGKEGSPGKNFSPFLEVNVKQEEEDPPSEDNNAISESPGMRGGKERRRIQRNKLDFKPFHSHWVLKCLDSNLWQNTPLVGTLSS